MKTACDVTTDRPGKPGCRTCAMAMLVSWYMDELRAHGFTGAAEELEKVALDEKTDPKVICKLMDDIAERVDDTMKKRIGELNEVFDHHARRTEEEG